MSAFGRTWALCGGWAADAWIGRETREHHDVDVAVFHEDQRALFEHMAGWCLVGHDDNVEDDSTEPWNGRHLDLPAHVHTQAKDGFEPEFHLNERRDGNWVFRREPLLALPLEQVIRPSPWDVPVLSPEVVVYYKALSPMWRGLPRPPPRAHDDLDLEALLPILTARQRAWVREAVGAVDAYHPWLERLA